MITTLELFELHNRVLKSILIDGELPEAFYSIDPNDELFDTPLNTKNYGSSDLEHT